MTRDYACGQTKRKNRTRFKTGDGYPVVVDQIDRQIAYSAREQYSSKQSRLIGEAQKAS